MAIKKSGPDGEAKRILSRVDAETEARMKRDGRADAPDRIEIVGTRIGRALGLVLLAVLLWWLFDFIVRAG